MGKEIIAFLPCRKGSERILEKNVKPFSGIEGGLTTIKLQQLIQCSKIDRIVVSTDDPVVIKIARDFSKISDKPIDIYERPKHLSLSSTSMDELILYIPEIIPSGIIFWVHVTEPFADQNTYAKAIELYHQNVIDGDSDSLMSVTSLQTFLWDSNGSINYDRNQEKWPRSQDLPTYYEINCAIFMISSELMKKYSDRVGKKPFFYELTFPEWVDIDIEEDFLMAETIWDSLISKKQTGEFNFNPFIK